MQIVSQKNIYADCTGGGCSSVMCESEQEEGATMTSERARGEKTKKWK